MHAQVRDPESIDDASAGDGDPSPGASALPFEANLESRERFYRALVEQTRDLITVVDRHGTILFKNRSTERTLGYTATELVGRNVFEHPSPQGMTAAISRIYRDGWPAHQAHQELQAALQAPGQGAGA